MDLGIKFSQRTLEEMDHVLSAIITSDDSSELIYSLLILVDKEECEGFYHIFIRFLERIAIMKTTTRQSKVKLSYELFKRHVNIGVKSMVEDPAVNINSILDELDFNDTIPDTDEGKLRRQQVLFSYCMEKYEELNSRQVNLLEGTLVLDTLYSSIIEDYSINSVRMGASVLQEGVQIGREEYKGSEGYLDLTRLTLAKVAEKQALWTNLQNSIIVMDSIENYNKLMEKNNARIKDICKLGLKPIDEYATLTTGDIVNLTATEGTGKTTFCCALSARQILAGYSVVYMCGETVPTIIVNMVLSHFIFLTRGYEINWKEIMYIYNLLTSDMLDDDERMEEFEGMPEEYITIVNDAKHQMFTNPDYGKLIPVQNFTYNNFRNEICNIYDANPELKFGHNMIDHTDALIIDNEKGGVFLRDQSAAVKELFRQLIQVKNERGVPSFTTSHTGFNAERLILKGKDTGTRTGATSSSTSKDVDIVLAFESSPELKRQGLIKVTVKKYRSVEDTLFVPFIVQKAFTACRFVYTQELQEVLGINKEKELDTSDIGLNDMDAEDLI